MSGIRLHKTKGINAHMTVCPRCGEDGDEIALLGSANKIYECPRCNIRQLGSKICSKCKGSM